ncbi:hypothetical protein BRC64_00985 [Halobacteriales archaeon QH_10_67_22]|nr:MAG: hypothetical protein BRC64_00985 [Halobacteriales archaeon QH_10_67_22]
MGTGPSCHRTAGGPATDCRGEPIAVADPDRSEVRSLGASGLVRGDFHDLFPETATRAPSIVAL